MKKFDRSTAIMMWGWFISNCLFMIRNILLDNTKLTAVNAFAVGVMTTALVINYSSWSDE